DQAAGARREREGRDDGEAHARGGRGLGRGKGAPRDRDRRRRGAHPRRARTHQGRARPRPARGAPDRRGRAACEARRMGDGTQDVSARGVIGWALRRWQKRFPGPVLAISLVLLVAGVVLLVVWILRDLSRGQILRPSIAVLVLAALSLRVIVSFNPRRR